MEIALRIAAVAWLVTGLCWMTWCARIQYLEERCYLGDRLAAKIQMHVIGATLGALTYGLGSILIGGAVAIIVKVGLFALTGSQYWPTP